MGMLNWKGWLDRTLQTMGYAKASGRGAPVATLFRGEAPEASRDIYSRFEPADWERLALTSSWVYSNVNIIAGTFASAALKVMRLKQDELTEIEEHPFEAIAVRPNPHMGGTFLWRYTLWWLLLRGEAYWWNVYTPSGELAELWPIPADRMAPIPDPQRHIRGFAYRFSDGSDTQIIPPQSVTYFRLPNPFDYHRGLSPLSACRLGLQVDREAQRWNLDQFQKGAPLRMIVTVPEDMNDVDFDRFRADINDQFAQGMQYLIGRAGDLDAKAIGLAPADLQYLAGREFTREELDRVFGIPAGFWAKEATRANSDAADNALLEKTIMPLHRLCAEQIMVQTLAYGYDDTNLRIEFEDVRKKDRALVIDERSQNWQVMTVNEARAELGLDPLDEPILGDMLVPLATKMAAPAGGFGAVPPTSLLRDDSEDAEEVEAFKSDIRRWRTLALRRFKEGKSLDYDFESDYIPPAVKSGIMAALDAAEDEEGIRNAFKTAARRAGAGWNTYP